MPEARSAATRRPGRWRPGGCALALAVVLGSCGAPAPPSLLLLVTVDTLRADRLGAYGGDLGLTPHLDALADESVVFTAAYASAPFTLPSVAALMTGRAPQELGVYRNTSIVPDTVPTLATALRERGWRTRAVVGNFVLRHGSGIHRGFEEFNDRFPQLEAVRKWPERVAVDSTDSALAMLDECAAAGAPGCFLWVHYQDPHGPYTPPDPYLERELARAPDTPETRRELPLSETELGIGALPRYQAITPRRDVGYYLAGYHAEIRYVDEQIGRLWEAVVARGWADRTLLAFAADHGEGLGERDYWFAHGEYLSEAQVRVPLLVRDPRRGHAVRTDLAALTDLPATLLAAVSPPDDGSPFAGRDLLAPGAEAGASRPYLATLGGSVHPRYGLVEGDFKMVITLRDGIWDGRLTRRGDDDVDLTAAAPQVAGPMRERLQQIRARMADGPKEITQELTEATLESLRALGYIEDDGDP